MNYANVSQNMKLCSECKQVLQEHGSECPACHHTVATISGHLAFAPELAAATEGFEADYFPYLADLEANNFWFRGRNELLIWALHRYFPHARTLLEIGCGTGFVLSGIRQTYPSLTLAGSEVLSAGLGFAAQRLPGVALFQMDARRIPFREEFDVIGAFDVLEHIREDEEVLRQMYQATNPGGGLLITVPQHPFLWSPVDVCAHHVRRYTICELKTKVERAGFNITRTTSFVSILLPLLFASRFRMRRCGDAPDSTEVAAGPFLNKVLERVLQAERRIIQKGFQFPAGGSLLLVAQRN